LNSGGHRGFTVVTIVTLMFAPIFAHHHWTWKFVGKTRETQIVQCAPKEPCPKRRMILKVVRVQPPVQPRGKQLVDSNDPDTVDNPDAAAGRYADDGDDGHQNRH
jgi:hypothetical protein